MAMGWVREHIADFSGDKDMVARLPRASLPPRRACPSACPCP